MFFLGEGEVEEFGRAGFLEGNGGGDDELLFAVVPVFGGGEEFEAPVR